MSSPGAVVIGGYANGVGVLRGLARQGVRTAVILTTDHDVAQQMDPLDAVHAELWRPQELTQVPRGLREVFVVEPPARFEHPDAVALLSEPKRGDTPPEPRTDDQNVIVRFHPNSMDLALAKF